MEDRMSWSRTIVSKNALATDAAEYGWPRVMKWANLEKRPTTVKITDFGKSLDEVHGYVTPDRARHDEWSKDPDRVKMLCFVALAH
jgi:hypothetical protein